MKISEIIPLIREPIPQKPKATGYGFERVLRKEMENIGLSKDVDGNENPRKRNRPRDNEPY